MTDGVAREPERSADRLAFDQLLEHLVDRAAKCRKARATGLLAGGDPADALRELVRHACETLGAQGAGVNVPVEDGQMWRVAVTEGSYARWQDLLIPAEGTITATAVATGDLVVVADPTTDPRTTATAHEAVGQVGESLAVPLRGDRGITGVLVASRRPGEHGFDHIDREIIRAIAHAGMALELAQVRQDNENLRLLEDRAHIAEDLRRQVIQPMFDLGLSLQGAVARGQTGAARRDPGTGQRGRSDHQGHPGRGIPPQPLLGFPDP